MAQLDFPPQEINGQLPLDGTIWTAPNGRQWQYDSAVPGWRSLGFRGPGIVYRGGIDLTQDPATQYANIVSGNLFTVTVGADPTDGNLYPGLDGDSIQRGDQIIFDGVEYQLIDYGQPLATETVPGIVYLATQDEVNAGTNTTDAVTPATLSTYVDNNAQAPLPNGNNGQYLSINNNGDLVFVNLPQATTTTEGITRYATDAEAIAGVEQNAAVTPSNLLAAIQVLGAPVPTGAIFHFATSVAPEGYLVCDGSILNPITYPALVALLGTTYGQQGQLPDLRDEFIRGSSGSRAVGTTQTSAVGTHDHTATSTTTSTIDTANGVEIGRTISSTELYFGDYRQDGYHQHQITVYQTDSDPEGGGSGGRIGAAIRPDTSFNSTDIDEGYHSHRVGYTAGSLNVSSSTSTTVNAGGGAETRPQNIALLPCIKY